MDTILITGSNGYIGTYLRNYFIKKGYDTFGLDLYNNNSKNKYQCDLNNKDQLKTILNKLKPDIIIHTVGLSSLDKCERDPEHAYQINTVTTQNIIHQIKEDIPETGLIFLSTDYVFDGKKGGYKETDKTSPETVYGKTKLEAEAIIKNSIKNYAICRTANVYGHGGNFFNFVLTSLKQGVSIDVFSDTFFSPTYIGNLVEMINSIIEKKITGVFHTAGCEAINRYDFAKKIAEAYQKDIRLINSIKKPHDSLLADNVSLDISFTQKKIDVKSFDIREGLESLKE